MSQAPSVAFAAKTEDSLVGASANVSLRGTTRGLEILISGSPSTAALGARLTELFAEAPSFFAGSSARVAIDGALPSGALGCLEEVATRFAVQIVEIGPVAPKRRRLDIPTVLRPEDVPQVHLAEGTGPIAEETAGLRGSEPGAPSSALPALPADMAPEVAPGIARTNIARADTVPAEARLDAAASDAAPTEVAFANTAPIDVASLAASPGDAASSTTEPTGGAPASTAPATTEPGTAALDAAASATAETSTVTPVATASITAEPSAAANGAAGNGAAGNGATGNGAAGNGAGGNGAAPTAAQLDALVSVAAAMTPEPASVVPPGPRLVIGPVRSGVIVDHTGHVIVIGDVNPGAELRAEGSIIVLGRLRGVAHAAIGREAGCIIALSLQPQQLRIGRMVARAGDADRPGDGAEIAYATGETIVVERFLGRLPSGLAASM